MPPYSRAQPLIRAQAVARGFRAVVRPEWARMFGAADLRRLISGDAADIDIDDLQSHVVYEGGFHGLHGTIRALFEVLREFTAEQRAQFLKFVTSCSRPPLLGFAHLQPPLTIRMVVGDDPAPSELTLGWCVKLLRGLTGTGPDVERLPTASTCFNLLKLPAYRHKRTLRAKLLYAIGSGAGFELS
jgi:ubiquitin-protein ligase E3 B